MLPTVEPRLESVSRILLSEPGAVEHLMFRAVDEGDAVNPPGVVLPENCVDTVLPKFGREFLAVAASAPGAVDFAACAVERCGMLPKPLFRGVEFFFQRLPSEEIAQPGLSSVEEFEEYIETHYVSMPGVMGELMEYTPEKEWETAPEYRLFPRRKKRRRKIRKRI